MHFRRATRPVVFRFSGFWFSRLFRRTRLTRQTRPRPARPPTSPDSSDGPLRWTARRPRQLRYPDSSRRPVRPPPAQTDLQTDIQTLTFVFFGFFFGPCNPSKMQTSVKYLAPPQLEHFGATRPQISSKYIKVGSSFR